LNINKLYIKKKKKIFIIYLIIIYLIIYLIIIYLIIYLIIKKQATYKNTSRCEIHHCEMH